MSRLEKSVEVDLPVRVVYDQWTQFEDFPRFMEGIESVEQLDDRRLLWRAKLGGRQEEWEAEITYQEPDERIGWRSTTGAENSGIVAFDAVNPNRTRVRLELTYEPSGASENVGDLLGVVSRRVQGDLDRFKEFIEARGRATGGWRGQVRGTEVR